MYIQTREMYIQTLEVYIQTPEQLCPSLDDALHWKPSRCWRQEAKVLHPKYSTISFSVTKILRKSCICYILMPVYFSLRNAEISKVRIYFEETKLSQKCCISCSLLYKKCSFSENVCCRRPCIWKYEHQWTEACSSLSCWPTLLPPWGLLEKEKDPPSKRSRYPDPFGYSFWRCLVNLAWLWDSRGTK